MAILRVRDDKGNITDIPAIKGDKGDRGGGFSVGSYVGDAKVGTFTTQYIDLGSPDVKAVLLETTSASKPIIIVDENTTLIDGKDAARLIKGTIMGDGDNMFLAVHSGDATNQIGVTYRYIAFIE